MSITRKGYGIVAEQIRLARSATILPTTQLALDQLARNLAQEFLIDAGYDLNGNRRFKTVRFLTAAGVPQ